MTRLIIHQLYAALAPWMAFSLFIMGRNPRLSRLRIIGSLLLAFFLLRIPVEGWASFAWIRVLEPNPSFTLTALLGIALFQRVTQKNLFRSVDWNGAWIFGSVASLALYPMGLGLTSMDPYAWGWGVSLPIAAALCSMFFLLRGNRFGILLLLCLAGFLADIQESRNFWDALLDPLYGAVSLVIVAVRILRSGRKAIAMTPTEGIVKSNPSEPNE